MTVPPLNPAEASGYVLQFLHRWGRGTACNAVEGAWPSHWRRRKAPSVASRQLPHRGSSLMAESYP
jgi:hypothetical protein